MKNPAQNFLWFDQYRVKFINPHKMETKQYLMINYRTNIFCCADDVVLLAPSSEGLQIMIDIVNLML